MPDKPLNVIVICCDTLRADVVDHTWEDYVQMPNLDRFRKESTYFSHAFGEALPTIPMRRGFYTGKRSFPWRYDINDKGSVPNLLGWHAIPPDQPTLAETLCSAGVMTGLVSDLYHEFKPTMNFTRGFVSYDYIRGQENDRVRSGPISKVDLKPHLHPDDKDFKRHTGLTQYLLNTMDRRSEEDYFAPRVFRSASRWIDDNAAQKPFMLWIESFTPHEFWDPPKAFADAYFKKEGIVDYTYPQFFQKNYNFTEDEIRRTKALYYGYCTFLDKWVGAFFRKLDEHKLWDNTVVIFTSDHGTQLRDRTMFGKSQDRLNAFNTRLNLMVHHPDSRFHGKTSDALVQNTDLAPTICALAGVPPAEPFDGKNLLPVLEGKEKKLRDHVVGAWGNTAYVRNHAYNLIVDTYAPEKVELYDLSADPREKENIAAAKPKVVAEMIQHVASLTGPLPAKYAHQVRGNQAPGINKFIEHWQGSNLGS